jgi:hypothetical protein
MSKGVKETNDVLKFGLLVGIVLTRQLKDGFQPQDDFEEFIEKLKDSDELKAAFKDIKDVPAEMLDLHLDDLPEAIKLATEDVVWFLKKLKGK